MFCVDLFVFLHASHYSHALDQRIDGIDYRIDKIDKKNNKNWKLQERTLMMIC